MEEVNRKPWAGWAGTCSRCWGPWDDNCARGRCKRAPKWLDAYPYDCALCDAPVTTLGPRPAIDDHVAWEKVQAQHKSTCPWATTRGYQQVG
jgi:hypothetical protein